MRRAHDQLVIVLSWYCHCVECGGLIGEATGI